MTRCGICNASNNTKILNVRSFEIRICNECDNGFTLPAPSNIDYKEADFHSQFSHNSVNALPRQWKNSLKKEAEIVKKHVGKEHKILEIGCGRGLFLKYLKDQGLNVYGVEPSRSAANSAKENGLNVEQGYYPDIFGNMQFDLIFMAQVLEHIENPLGLLREIGSRNPGKYLILVQTNYKGWVVKKNKNLWYGWLPEEHFWHFSPKGIENICKKLDYTYCKTSYSTLEHKNYWLSLITELIPPTQDQFISLIKL